MRRTHPPRILVIAGSDSSGGAGIQADIKTITMLGGYAMTAITALTAQNTLGVTRVDPVDPAMVAAQIDACVSDIGVDAIKIGMLGSATVAEVVAERLAALAVPIVFDPVMVATSGAPLADPATIAAFEVLMRLATLTTPNLPELAALGGEQVVRNKTTNLLIKGGHAESDELEDVLITPKGEYFYFRSRIHTVHTHGTGCSLASAIAVGLGSGMSLDFAVDRAVQFVHDAISHAPGLGHGQGPIGHAMARVAYYDALAAADPAGWDAAAFEAKWS